jgi:hypothetical protein
VQVFWDYQGNDLFSKTKPRGPGASVLWTDRRWSTVDSRRRRPMGSPELTLGDISGRQTSLREYQKEEGCSRNLTVKLDGGGVLETWPAMRH